MSAINLLAVAETVAPYLSEEQIADAIAFLYALAGEGARPVGDVEGARAARELEQLGERA